MSDDKDPYADRVHKIDNRIYQRLGLMVTEWAKLEAILAEFLSYLLRADSGSMYVLNQTVASSTQLSWIRVLAEYRFEDVDTSDALGSLFDRIDDARAERNVYVHGVWAPAWEFGTATVQTIRLTRTTIVREQFVTRADLDDLVGEIAELSVELNEFGAELGFLPPS